jgi:hypothetical protein
MAIGGFGLGGITFRGEEEVGGGRGQGVDGRWGECLSPTYSPTIHYLPPKTSHWQQETVR